VGLQPPKLQKLVIFGINLPKKGILPQAIFIKFGCWEGVPGLHIHTKFHHSGFKNVGLQPQKIAIFGINLPLLENVGGPRKKLNIGAQLQSSSMH